jgi:hypothetical protein
LSFLVRPAAPDRPTIGSTAPPVTRSLNQSESKRFASS